MPERQEALRLAALRTIVLADYNSANAGELGAAIDAALQVPPPLGSPDAISAVVETLVGVAGHGDRAQVATSQLRLHTLPTVWSGKAHAAATHVLGALERELNDAHEAFASAAKVTNDYADTLREIQRADSRGADLLQHARGKLDRALRVTPADGDTDAADAAVKVAQQDAISGVEERFRAASNAERADERAGMSLHALAGQARLSRLGGSQLDPVTALAAADARSNGRPILSPFMADRAALAMAVLAVTRPDDFKKLMAELAAAKSPQAQAWILKVLANGYGIAQVSAFADRIQAHSGDPAWLTEHLDVGAGAGSGPVTFDGASWAQSREDNCVADVVVVARAEVDPVYALWLTTGNHVDDPSYENSGAFASRLIEQERAALDMGRAWDEPPPRGLSPDEAAYLARETVSPHTGVGYHDVELHTEAQRHEYLDQAVRAIQSTGAAPVPIAMSDDSINGHELLIDDYNSGTGQLRIYDPFTGSRTWISQADFVHNHVNIAQGIPSKVYSIQVPD